MAWGAPEFLPEEDENQIGPPLYTWLPAPIESWQCLLCSGSKQATEGHLSAMEHRRRLALYHEKPWKLRMKANPKPESPNTTMEPTPPVWAHSGPTAPPRGPYTYTGDQPPPPSSPPPEHLRMAPPPGSSGSSGAPPSTSPSTSPPAFSGAPSPAFSASSGAPPQAFSGAPDIEGVLQAIDQTMTAIDALSAGLTNLRFRLATSAASASNGGAALASNDGDVGMGNSTAEPAWDVGVGNAAGT